jgi:capsular polysaccharide biosynthesis protein
MENERNRTLQTEGEIEIDLFELLFLFRTKLKAILLCAVIGALLVGLYTWFFIPPKYQATAKLYIVSASSNSVVNLTDLQIATNLTSDYKELILSRPMMESTIRNLHLDGQTYISLRNMLSVTNASGTRILHITATTLDPELSCKIANEVARLSVSWLPEVMETNEPNIAEEAVVPLHRASPSYSKNAILGALVGAVLCYCFALLQYIMDDTITSPDQMEKYFC